MESLRRTPRIATAALLSLWRDERAYVHAAELILISTIAIIGLLVGLAAYRDAVVSELDDTGSAIGSLNQSYNVEVTASNGGGLPGYVLVSATGTTVTVEGTFAQLTSTSTFANFSYTDMTDACDDTPILFTGVVIEEGQDLDGNPVP